MKKIIAILTVISFLLCAGLACAGELKIDAMSKEKIQLDVTLRFNAVEPSLAIRIMEYLSSFFGPPGLIAKACKLEYSVKDVESSLVTLDDYVTSSSFDNNYDAVTCEFPQGGYPYTIFGRPCYNDESDAEAHCPDGYYDTCDSDGFRFCCSK